MIFFQQQANAAIEVKATSLLDGGQLRLQVAGAGSDPVSIEASADFRDWDVVATGTPDANGEITFTESEPRPSKRFYRVAAQADRENFHAVVRALYGSALTNATVQIEPEGKIFSANSSGEVAIPVADLTFGSGFRLTAAAPGYFSETIDLPPSLYNYTFNLTLIPIAPAQIVGRTFDLGGSNLITLYTDVLRFSSVGKETIGAYSATRSTTVDDTWSVVFGSPTGAVQYAMTFTSTNAGQFSEMTNGQPAVSGTFTEASDPHPITVTPTAAPVALHTIRFVNVTSPLGSGLDFTIALSGETNGTFQSSGYFTGEGTFTYTTTDTGARLRLDYVDDFAGDFDDFNLTFLSASGLGADGNTFTGSMGVEQQTGPASGTFSYE